MAEQLGITMAIDNKQNRLRIHKPTLHALGDPRLIQLLINVEQGALAIRAVKRKEKNGHEIRITEKELCGKDFELHSQMLVSQLRKWCGNMSENQTYRLTGTLHDKYPMVLFPFKTLVQVDSE